VLIPVDRALALIAAVATAADQARELTG